MGRSIVFAALLGGVGLGAWTSFSAPLRPPGLDFSALASTLQQHLPPPRSQRTQQKSTHTLGPEQPQSSGAHLMNASLSVDGADPAPAAQPEDVLAMAEASQEEDACGAWSISDVGMEAILRELISRGWTPPTGSRALSVSQPKSGPPIEALNPDSPAFPILPDAKDADESESMRKPTKFTN